MIEKTAYWEIVGAVYIADIAIFAYLAYYFLSTLRRTTGEGRIVVRAMAILTTVLFFQELYFGINTATDPNKLAILPGAFPAVSSVWLYAKLILTFGGIIVIYTLTKLKR